MTADYGHRTAAEHIEEALRTRLIADVIKGTSATLDERDKRYGVFDGHAQTTQLGSEPVALTLSATLDERGKRYGVFVGHAQITQRLKNVVAEELMARDKLLDDDQQEALDMICHKIGRIVNGDANYGDSWIDIAGYAQLVADRLNGKPR